MPRFLKAISDSFSKPRTPTASTISKALPKAARWCCAHSRGTRKAPDYGRAHTYETLGNRVSDSDPLGVTGVFASAILNFVFKASLAYFVSRGTGRSLCGF